MDEDEVTRAALTQLAFLGAYGLLLTPEPMTIPVNPNAANSAGMKSTFTQCRASFTLIERSDLWSPGASDNERVKGKSHAGLFGTYAIGLDPLDARVFGVAPVTYYYNGLEALNRTHELLFRLRELHNLCSVLAFVEGRIAAKDALSEQELKDRGLFPQGVDDTVKRIATCDPETLRIVYDLIDTERPADWRLVDNLKILLDTFQTTDSGTSMGSLAYYEQREWRITRAFGKHLDVRSLGPSGMQPLRGRGAALDRENLRAILAATDDFFTPERLDACVVIAGTTERRFFAFVREVIAPTGEAAERVSAWLDEFSGGFNASVVNYGEHIVFERRNS